MPTTPTIRRALVLVAAVALLALTGCGASRDTSANGTSPTAAADDGGGSSAEDSTSYPTQPKKACDILTAAVAKSLLGSVAPETAPSPKTSSAHIVVSTCVRTNAVTTVQKSGSATLLMRVARDATGAESNIQVFATPSTAAQPVSGYGEKAFWTPGLGQLNILGHGNWYILSIGPIDPRKHTLAQTLQLADAIKDQL
jgi:hypothetical protein